MAKSGITLELSKGGNLAHNNREHKIDYLIDGNYFCDRTSAQALEYLQVLRAEAQKNYTERTKQKMQIDINDNKFLWSAVVNLNQDHTLENVQELAKELEKKYGWQCIQVSLHHDEGYIDDDNNQHKNYHAHIEFLGLDSKGNSIKRKIKKKDLIEIQTDVAKLLEMERGRNFNKEFKEFKNGERDTMPTKAKRLDTYEYKA
ncbi:MAG: hypothetical protein IE909_18000, partial [Campylobacterales bacterium]|nr:hypothetical protein [Campylobacterales bacterium]